MMVLVSMCCAGVDAEMGAELDEEVALESGLVSKPELASAEKRSGSRRWPPLSDMCWNRWDRCPWPCWDPSVAERPRWRNV